MKFFTVCALLATSTTSAIRLEEGNKVEAYSQADIKEFVQTLERINSRIKQRDQEIQKG